jgi:outer membrane lipoprotein-sorting protein
MKHYMDESGGTMKTGRILSVLSIVILLAISATAQDLTLEQILKKNEDALGGAEAISKVQTLRTTSRMVMGESQMEMAVTISTKRPNSIRTEMSFMGYNMVSAYDGTTAWMINPTAGSPEPQKMDAETTAKFTSSTFASALGSLAGIKESGNAVEFLGKGEVNGSPAYKIKVSLKAGVDSVYYIDAQSFLPVKITSKISMMGQEVEGDTFPSNYKKVDGILFAHSTEVRASGQIIQANYDKIEVNVPMDDSIFKMPVKETPPVKK